MVKTKRKVLGRSNDISDIYTINGRVIPADYKRIASINRELRKKCEKQRQNDAEALVIASTMYAV